MKSHGVMGTIASVLVNLAVLTVVPTVPVLACLLLVRSPGLAPDLP